MRHVDEGLPGKEEICGKKTRTVFNINMDIAHIGKKP